MDGLRFLLETPQLCQTHKKCLVPLIPCDNCHIKIIKYVQVKSQPHFEACETSNSPCQSRDQEHHFAERSLMVTRASAGPSPAPSRRSSSQSVELPAVSLAWGESIYASDWYWGGTQASPDRGHPSSNALSSPLYDLSSSPQSSDQDQWLSSPLIGFARPHYESGKQQSCTSSLLQLSNGSLRGYYTSYDIADTSNSQWNHMFNHVLPPLSSRQVSEPHPTMPVHRQNGPQSPNYPANDPKTLYLSMPSSAFGVASRSVQRGAPNLDFDPALNEPIVDVSLCEGQLPPVDRVYLTANTPPSPDTHDYTTQFPSRPTQFSSDSLAITLETASVSPHQQSASPGPHTITSHLSLSPSSPESVVNVFAVNSQQWRDVAIAESETSPENISPIETDPASTTIQQQDRTTDLTVVEEPNFCHPCRVSFTLPQVFRRHLKDKHEDKESCTHCLNFKWSRGRPYLYQRHLRLKHPEVTSSEDRLRRTQKSRAVGARHPNRKTEATSGRVCPLMTVFPDHLLHPRAS